MELHQLECFLAVLDEGSFNRAAGALHRTQPAISYQIKQLEEELGVRLFFRRGRSISPTESGRVLAGHAREVLDGVRTLRSAVARLSEGVTGEIRIGTVNSVGIHFLPEVLWTMRERYPGVRTMVMYRESPAIMDALVANRIDLALAANPRPDRRYRQEVIVQERVSLVCGRSHPFFGRKSIRPAELKGLQFVALTPEHPTGQLVRDFLAKLGVDVEPVVSTANVETVKKMVEVGLGVAMLPDMVTGREIACTGEPLGRLARIDVGPPLMRSIELVTWRHRTPSAAVAAFIDELRSHGANWRACVDPPDCEGLKSPAAKSPAAKSPAAKSSAAKSSAAKSSAAKSSAAKSSAAKSSAAKSPAAKSPAAKSSAAKSPAPKRLLSTRSAATGAVANSALAHSTVAEPPPAPSAEG